MQTVFASAFAALIFLRVDVAAAQTTSSGAEVSLWGRWVHGFAGDDWAGLVSLTIPWDQWLLPRAFAHLDADPEDSEEDSESEQEQLDEQAVDALLKEPEPSTADPEAKRRGARDGNEPDLVISPRFAQRLLKAVENHAQVAQASARLDSFGTRARTSAALPKLQVSARRSTDESLRLAPTESDPDRFTLSGGDDLSIEGKLSWDLDRLVFAREELAVERLRIQREEQRLKRVREALEALFEWQAQVLRAADPRLTAEERLEAALLQLQAAALLDALSGGWFSEQVALLSATGRSLSDKSTADPDSGLDRGESGLANRRDKE